MAREKKPPEEDNPLRWLVTYGDVVTLMMAFFVMLYAISQVDQQKFMLFVSGLETPFKNESVQEGILEGGIGVMEQMTTEAEEDQLSELEGLGGNTDLDPSESAVSTTTSTSTTTTVPQVVIDPEVTPEDLLAIQDAIQGGLIDSEVPVDIGVRTDFRGLIVSIATDGVLFPTGSADVQQRGFEILGVLAPILADYPNDILVEGHTDNVPLNRGGYTNWDLSVDRALAVLKILESEFEIQPTRLAATGYGEWRPLASNETDDGRSQNRRVELVVVAGPESETP